MRKYTNLDAATSVFFERQLEYVKSKTYDVRYPELKARMIVPVSNEAGPGAETIKYEQYDEVGIGQIVANYAKDLPRADIKGKEFIVPVRSIGASFGYSVQDIRAAQMAGLPLQARKANAAKRAILIKENRIAFFGDSDHGLNGLINHPNITEVTLPNDGSGSARTFLSKSAELVIRDLNSLVTSVIVATKGVEAPNTLLLSPSHWAYLTTLKIPYSDKTVLRFFLENSPTCKNAEVIPELETAVGGSTPKVMVYDRNPDKLTLEIPQDFEQFPPQEKGLEFEIPCHSRCGGVIVYYPLSIAYTDNAGSV